MTLPISRWTLSDCIDFVKRMASSYRGSLTEETMEAVLKALQMHHVSGSSLLLFSDEEWKELIPVLGLRIYIRDEFRKLIHNEKQKIRYPSICKYVGIAAFGKVAAWIDKVVNSFSFVKRKLKLKLLVIIFFGILLYSIAPTFLWGVSLRLKQARRHFEFSANKTSESRVRWVFLVHVSCDTKRLDAITKTWFRSNSEDIGLMTFGDDWMQKQKSAFVTNSESAYGSSFKMTQHAFANALQLFPLAEYFAKFDDDAYVYHRELIRQIKNSTGHYWGYPMRLGSLIYGSGGAGYVLSREATVMLQLCDTSPFHHEDAAVGECMNKSGIYLKDLIGLHPHHPYQMIRWDKYGHPKGHVRKEPVEGYVNPLSYHFIDPAEMLRMHDDIHLHGFPMKRSNAFPRIFHQFWTGRGKPEFLLQKCKEIHHNWAHILWDKDLISAQFPSNSNNAGSLQYNGFDGELVNQNYYQEYSTKSLNMLSDITRYEVIMMYGGIYVDADSNCLRPIDHLLDGELGNTQGFGFLELDENFFDGMVASGVMGTYAFSPLSVALVSQLQHTDWTQPAWKSAGPLYFTKILRLFNRSALPEYLRVQVFDSYLVYPNHHGNKSPSPTLQTVVRRGSIMDQQWGQTKNLYKSKKWEGLEWIDAPLQVEVSRDDKWGSLLLDFARNVHRVGLSSLATTRPRWVIASLQAEAEIGQKIMGMVSTMAFALATGRALLFDWDEVDELLTDKTMKNANLSSLTEFAEALSPYSYRKALERFGLDNKTVYSHGLHIGRDDENLTEMLLSADLDVEYNASFVFIHRSGWWAPALIRNRLYSKFVFRESTPDEVFSVLFKFLYPSQQEPQSAEPCHWLIHYMAHGEQSSPPFEAFLSCAREHGASAADSVILSTDAGALKTGSPSIPFKVIPSCRSTRCDVAAVLAVRDFSRCGRAVLWERSSVGECISRVGMLSDAYYVTADNKCHKKQEEVQPRLSVYELLGFSADTETGSEPEASAVTHSVYAVAMLSPTDREIRAFQRRLAAKRHPVVLFVRDADKWRYLQFVVSARVILVEWSEAMGPMERHEAVVRYDNVLPFNMTDGE